MKRGTELSLAPNNSEFWLGTCFKPPLLRTENLPLLGTRCAPQEWTPQLFFSPAFGSVPDLRLYLLRHLSFITKNGPCLQLRSVLSHLPAHRRVGAQRPCFHFQLSFSVQTDTALLNSILSKPLWVSCEFYTVFLRVPERHIHHSFQDMPVCTLDRSDCCGMTPLGLLESVSG